MISFQSPSLACPSHPISPSLRRDSCSSSPAFGAKEGGTGLTRVTGPCILVLRSSRRGTQQEAVRRRRTLKAHSKGKVSHALMFANKGTSFPSSRLAFHRLTHAPSLDCHQGIRIRIFIPGSAQQEGQRERGREQDVQRNRQLATPHFTRATSSSRQSLPESVDGANALNGLTSGRVRCVILWSRTTVDSRLAVARQTSFCVLSSGGRGCCACAPLDGTRFPHSDSRFSRQTNSDFDVQKRVSPLQIQ